MGAIISVRSRLKTILDGLVTAGTIALAYNYQPLSAVKTPSAAIVYAGGHEEITDCQNNSSINEFVIRAMTEKPDSDASTTYDTQTTQLLTITDAILDQLRDDVNWTLGGDAYYTLTTKVSEILIDSTEDLRVMYQDITVTIKTLKSV